MEKKRKIEPVQIQEPVSSSSWAVDNKILVIAVVGIAILLMVIWKGNILSLGSDTVVIVNGNDITEAQFQDELSKIPAYYFSMMDNATIRSAILDQLIARELLLEKVDALGITVTQQEVEEALANITAGAQMTQEQFMQKLEEENMTLDEVEELLKQQIAVNKVIESEVLKNVQVTEEEIKTYYTSTAEDLIEVQASHILICYNGALRCEQNRTKEEALEQASNIIAELKAGTEFADLAKEYSDDPSAEFNDGNLGWFSKGQMVPEFENAVFSMNIGEITDEPVETDYGYHVIMVTDTKDSFDDFKDTIAQQLSLEKQQTAVEEYLAALKEAAEIVYK